MMKRTGFLYDERFLSHETGTYHPEVPERLKSIYQGIEDAGLLPRLKLIKARRAEQRWIETVHDRIYIHQFQSACQSGQKIFGSPDNQMCCETYETALLAVGGVIDTVRRVLEGQIDNAFCAVRPPGHHAERSSAMGFCYFNNVAIAARYLQLQWNINRVAIVDFDVHHGNGTQHIFENDPSVFYYSIHQHPSFAYPGTGRTSEKGAGQGSGFTCNSPMMPGQGDSEYFTAIETFFLPAIKSFKPQVILVSAGFDAHADDDMSDICLSTAGFAWIMENIVDLAERYAGGRLVSILEGGYALNRLPELARDHVLVLLRETTP